MINATIHNPKNVPNLPTGYAEGATALQGSSSARYYHLVSAAALQSMPCPLYRLDAEKSNGGGSNIFIEVNKTSTLEIYRQCFSDSTDSPKRYEVFEGSLIQLSPLDREKIMQSVSI